MIGLAGRVVLRRAAADMRRAEPTFAGVRLADALLAVADAETPEDAEAAAGRMREDHWPRQLAEAERREGCE